MFTSAMYSYTNPYCRIGMKNGNNNELYYKSKIDRTSSKYYQGDEISLENVGTDITIIITNTTNFTFYVIYMAIDLLAINMLVENFSYMM